MCGLVFVAATLNGNGIIDLNNLDSYANQPVPAYIQEDNTPAINQITDLGATLGRVLFYDKSLSANFTVSCSSCHLQKFAFSDTSVASLGINGLTGRHAMRLVNSRFAEEGAFFWDERAASLEIQSTQPIQDHLEMGFSGTNGDPDLDSLLRRMEGTTHYQRLFGELFGDTVITEARMQAALAQFIRSIQSFDSRYDTARAQVNNEGMPFPGFTQQENQGKALFLAPPQLGQGGRVGGGAGCGVCHRPPEFDIAPNSRSNGVIGSLAGGLDLTNTRSPSLRDLVNPQGIPNGPFMHNGVFSTLEQVINHYDSIPDEVLQQNVRPDIDPRVLPGGMPQRLNLTQDEKDAMIAFLRTLTGSDMYTNPIWSDPFDDQGNLEVWPVYATSIDNEVSARSLKVYPNPVADLLQVKVPAGTYELRVLDLQGRVVLQSAIASEGSLDMQTLPAGVYVISVQNEKDHFTRKVVKW